ncbi:MAG: crotonase/enoyl-CoA hydratase family protein [Deltaproteobacteria bacterium]|nr:crotonase/enoyl-CoA hydratase family protein [Deltaproteobacteria bacterium]
MSEDPFKVEKEGSVAWLILNRPDKRNAMNQAFFDGMIRHFAQLDADPGVRAVIIRAEGKSFTGGLDLSGGIETPKGGSPYERESFRRWIIDLQNSMTAVEKCRKPVIAAIHSHCIGGGVDLTSACDIRLATTDAVFSIRETKMAMIADIGTLQRLPTIIGQGRFRELALTGRNFSAAEAYEMGYLSRVCKDREELYREAKKIADEIAACSPVAVQGTKEVILFTRDHGIQAGLDYVAQKNAAILPNDDLLEAIQAFLEKRPSEFKQQ